MHMSRVHSTVVASHQEARSSSAPNSLRITTQRVYFQTLYEVALGVRTNKPRDKRHQQLSSQPTSRSPRHKHHL